MHASAQSVYSLLSWTVRAVSVAMSAARWVRSSSIRVCKIVSSFGKVGIERWRKDAFAVGLRMRTS